MFFFSNGEPKIHDPSPKNHVSGKPRTHIDDQRTHNV